jgi:hypothetical protein
MPLIDAALLAIVLAASAAAGLAVLRLLDATPATAGDRLLTGVAVGLGGLGMLGLALAAAGMLRPLPLAVAGVAALAIGGRDLVATLQAVRLRGLGRIAPYIVVCAVMLAGELVAMIAPPVGGDQTKYQLVYPRLYAAAGSLVSTPWSFWGQMQFLENFVFAAAYALHGDVLARFLNGITGVLATIALGRLVEVHLKPGLGAAAGTIFFTLPITWSLMTRAGSDLPVVLYGALAVGALLEWQDSTAPGALRRAALLAGLAGGSKVMGLLVPALVGIGVLVVFVRRAWTVGAATMAAVTFGALVILAASPWYVRNAADTGNPVYPFAYGIFGGTHWSKPAGEYLADYYRQYQTTWAERREGAAYGGLDVARFPWDLTMHPESFENGAKKGLDVGPFALAFAPALLLVRRRRAAVVTVAAIGLGYAGIIAGGAWAHPRYVLPGVALVIAAAMPGARALLGRRLTMVTVVLTIIGNLAVTSRMLSPLWRDQVRVATGHMSRVKFLRRNEARYVFWEHANQTVPSAGKILVLEKIPHPYYVERPYVLASYLEQDLIDYRSIDSPQALALAAHGLGITHVAVDTEGLQAARDPFEAEVGRLWRAFLTSECDFVLRHGGYALYTLHEPTAVAAAHRKADG